MASTSSAPSSTPPDGDPVSSPPPQLTARLIRGTTLELTLISALAGFGKTTLLAEWLAAAQPTNSPSRGCLSTRLVINRGQARGDKAGMVFVVLGEEVRDIQDPDTADVSGSVQLPKVRVHTTEVLEKMSIARTFVRVGGKRGLFGPDLSSLFYDQTGRPQTLRTDEALWEPVKERVIREDGRLCGRSAGRLRLFRRGGFHSPRRHWKTEVVES